MLQCTIHSKSHKIVEFLYDQTVTNPAEASGKAGECKMLSEPVALKLAGRGIGRLTSDIIKEEELEGKPGEPKVLSDNIVARLESMGFVRVEAEVKPVKENAKDDTGKSEASSDSRPDLQGGDGDKKKAVRRKRSGKSLDTPAVGSGSEVAV